MKRILLMLLICVAGLMSHAQQTISENDLPEPIQKKFKKAYPKVTDADWTLKEDTYTAEFLVNKAKFSLSYNDKGEVVGKKEAVAITTLPPSIGPTVSKTHKGFKIKEAYKVTNEKKVVTYEIHAKNKAGDEEVMNFDAKGKVVKDE